jgi:Rod binding domain-containing protein
LAVLLREMRQTAQMEGGLLPHSVQEQTLQELFEGETARSLSGRAGLGLADLLHSYLTQNSPSVTDSGFRIRDSGFRPRREGRSPVLEA